MATAGLTEVLAALSLATDLGTGFAPEKGLRTCVAAVAIGAQAELSDAEMGDVFQVALLRSLGCTAHASENAMYFGDDLAFQRDLHSLDLVDPAGFERFGAWAGAERGGELRARFIEIAPAVGPRAAGSACEASRALGTRLGLRPGAIAALDMVLERWDGAGIPGGRAGEAVALPARIMHVAEQAVIVDLAGGPQAALATLSRRSGGQLDPALVSIVLADPDPLLAALQVRDPLTAALAAEPPPRARFGRDGLERVTEAFADLADLKCRFTLGHSRGVAALVDRAGELCGLDADTRGRLRRAALVHDVGRTSVSSGIWERPGTLSGGEMDQVRLHAYWSERVLARAPALADLAPLAGSHHERMDGSGYHRGASAAGLSLEARLLAAADVMQALREDRPHRPARDLPAAARALSDEAGSRRLDPEAVAALIEAAGAPPPRRAWPADLTDREVDVLRLAARGMSNKEIAEQLFVSAKTVQHHLAHVYDKTGRRTRAGAALFAMEHGLIRTAGAAATPDTTPK
jgi:HD-GYP domain-containing protein (c-di-GMP phosphodiesterase class II)/DNA-binding CsgD family transcriptional regulator